MNLNKFILDETPVPDLATTPAELAVIGARLCMVHDVFAGAWLELLGRCPDLGARPWGSHWAINPADRLELRAISEAIVAHLYRLEEDEFRWVLRNCDFPKDELSDLACRARLPAKGFWRTGVGSAEHPFRRAWECEPELRLTNLALIAFIELDRLKGRLGGDLAGAISAFAPINRSGGWQLPEWLRLRDYGLGQDERSGEALELRPQLRGERSEEREGELSWSDCRRIAGEWQALWTGGAGNVPAQLVADSRRSRRGGRDSARGQARLFGGDE